MSRPPLLLTRSESCLAQHEVADARPAVAALDKQLHDSKPGPKGYQMGNKMIIDSHCCCHYDPQEAAALRAEVAALTKQLHDSKKKFLTVAKKKQAEHAAVLAALQAELAAMQAQARAMPFDRFHCLCCGSACMHFDGWQPFQREALVTALVTAHYSSCHPRYLTLLHRRLQQQRRQRRTQRRSALPPRQRWRRNAAWRPLASGSTRRSCGPRRCPASWRLRRRLLPKRSVCWLLLRSV